MSSLLDITKLIGQVPQVATAVRLSTYILTKGLCITAGGGGYPQGGGYGGGYQQGGFGGTGGGQYGSGGGQYQGGGGGY